MKLLYIHQHFVTNEGHGGTRSYNVAATLVRHGWDVTVVTGIFDQGPFAADGRGLFSTEWIDGIKVVVCNVTYSNYQGFARRLWAFAAFAVLATIAAVRERGVDVVFATSTPLTVGWPGLVAGYVKRRPFVFEVRDIWPEDLVLSGGMSPGFFADLMTRMETLFYRRAARVLTVSPGFTDRLRERGLPDAVLDTVPLGGDGELYADPSPDVAWLDRHGLTGKTVAVYAGAHGYLNGLDYVLAAAEGLRDRPDVAVVLIGDGAKKPELQRAAAERGLANVVFADPVPRRAIPSILSACHVGLMILLDTPAMARVLPNKAFDYMFAGLPTVVNFAGTTRRMIESIGAGVGCDSGDPSNLARELIALADDPERRAEMGRRARQAALADYDRPRLAERLMHIFETCAAQRPRRTDRCRIR